MQLTDYHAKYFAHELTKRCPLFNQFERMLMQITRHELNGHAEFTSDSSFRLKSLPFHGNIPLGLYELPRRSGEAHLYRLNHPLAERILTKATSFFRALPIRAYPYRRRLSVGSSPYRPK